MNSKSSIQFVEKLHFILFQHSMLAKGNYYIQATNGKFVSCSGKEGKSLKAKLDEQHDNGIFTVAPNDDEQQTYSIIAKRNNNYVRAETDKERQLKPRSGGIGDKEKFLIIKNADDTYSLQQQRNGQWVFVDVNKKNKLYANKSDQVEAEHFRFIPVL